MQGHRRAHGVALLFPEILRPAFGEQPRQLRIQDFDFLLRKQRRQDEKPVVPESLDLCVPELHEFSCNIHKTLEQNQFACHHFNPLS